MMEGNSLASLSAKERTSLLRPGEGLESIKNYQVLLIFMDICCNVVVDSTPNDPIVILIAFGLQFIALIINLVMYIMGTASLAMKLGFRVGTMHHHEANAGALVTYLILTLWFYIWALKGTWTSISDHFSFTFLEESAKSHPLGLSVIRSANETGNLTKNSNSSVLDFHSLWTPSFISLYAVHRTVAVFYYVLYMQTMFVILNGPLFSQIGYFKETFTPSQDNFGGFEEQRGSRKMSLETVSSFVEGMNGKHRPSATFATFNAYQDEFQQENPHRNTELQESESDSSESSTPVKVVLDKSKRSKRQERRDRIRRSSEDPSA